MKIKQRFKRLITMNTVLILEIVTVIVALIVTIYSYNNTKKQASDIAHIAAAMVDGQALYDCALADETNEAYYESCDRLIAIKENDRECVYMYGFVPRDKNALYVFDIFTRDEIESGKGHEPEYEMGFEESWSNLGCAHDIYETGAEVDKVEISLFFQNDYGNLISYYAPVYNEAGELVMIIGVDYAFTDFVTMILLIVGLIIVNITVFVILLSRMELRSIDRAIVEPLIQIEEKTRGFSQSEHRGNFEQFLLPEKENPVSELDILSASINKMIRDTENYIQNLENVTAEKERVATELSLAASIQMNCLPCIFPAFPDIPAVDLYATMDPAKEVGGDFYDFFIVDDSHVAFVIADVSGKGIPAALFMMIGKAMIKNQAIHGGSAADTLTEVNRQICENNKDSMFITAWIGILDITTGHMDTASAGHEFPAIRRSGTFFELMKDKHGLPLGVFENTRYKSYEIILQPGDSFFVYTDGVPEATNNSDHLFGTGRMLDALNGNPGCDVNARLKAVQNTVAAFVGDAPQFDDMTMLTVDYRG